RRGGGVRAHQGEEPEVDAVAEEDAREAPADQATDAGFEHGARHVLARGAGAEVLAHDQDRVAAEPVAQRRVEALEEVLLHLDRVLDAEVRPGIEDVRVDVVARDDDAASLADHDSTVAGSTVSPATA